MVTAHQKTPQTWTYGSSSQAKLHIDGQLWINITTTDAYGRTAVDVYTYLVDDEVTSTPTLATTGTQTIINGSTYLGPNGRISVSNIIDAGGVGVDSAECVWNAWHRRIHCQQQTHHMTPPSNSSTTTHSRSTVESWTKSETSETTQPSSDLSISKLQQQRSCRWLETPSRPTQPSAFATTDANLNGTSTATITWINTTSSWNTTVAYNGTWNGIHCRTQQQPG